MNLWQSQFLNSGRKKLEFVLMEGCWGSRKKEVKEVTFADSADYLL